MIYCALLDELPKKFQEELKDEGIDEYDEVLIIEHSEDDWTFHLTNMEPEDATFGRDLSWVIEELQKYDKKLYGDKIDIRVTVSDEEIGIGKLRYSANCSLEDFVEEIMDSGILFDNIWYPADKIIKIEVVDNENT